MTTDGAPEIVYLIQGEDSSLVAQELTELIGRLANSESVGAMGLEEYGQEGANDSIALSAVIDACRTPPFLSDRRLVVLRDAETLNAEQLKELVAYLEDPMDTTTLVLSYLTGRSGRAPQALAKIASAKGRVIAAEPKGRERTEWFASHVRASAVKLDQKATSALQAHLGEDLARLEPILDTLASTYGPGTTVSSEQLAPYLGEQGSVAPWDLTDAIDAGDAGKALSALHRLMEAGERHPLALVATLHRHYGAMLALDGSGASTDEQAGAVTGLGPYPARKALAQARRLGHERIARAISLLANADLDLRGQSAVPGELVLEILVARLTQDARAATSLRQRARSATRERE
jgi:DNA polymerase-3 subunit delta